VVFVAVFDPVGQNFVASLARPDTNATGLTFFEFSVTGKMLEALKQIAPVVSRVALAFNPNTLSNPPFMRAIEAAAPTLAVELVKLPLGDPGEIEGAFAALARQAGGGLLFLPDPFIFTHRDLIVGLAARHRLPAVYSQRPGAAGNVATEAVVNAPADGYTLLAVSPGAAINATLYDKLSFDFLRDMAPVAGLLRVANVMAVTTALPVRTVPEFIAHAKANPNRISYGSAGTGSSNHLSGELLKMMAGVPMVHVPYRGAAPALTDVISGQVQLIFSSVTSTVEYIKADKLRALAVTSLTRSEVLPELPPIADFVPGYEVINWWGIAAPKATAQEVIDKLNREINIAFADPKIKARLFDLGGPPLAGSPAEFGKLIADETEKWAKVIRAANIKLE